MTLDLTDTDGTVDQVFDIKYNRTQVATFRMAAACINNEHYHLCAVWGVAGQVSSSAGWADGDWLSLRGALRDHAATAFTQVRSHMTLPRVYKKKKKNKTCAIPSCCFFIYLVNVMYTFSRTHATEFPFNSSQTRKTALENKKYLMTKENVIQALNTEKTFKFIFVFIFFLQFNFQLFLNKAS